MKLILRSAVVLSVICLLLPIAYMLYMNTLNLFLSLLAVLAFCNLTFTVILLLSIHIEESTSHLKLVKGKRGNKWIH
jgi:hypothetical protein